MSILTWTPANDGKIDVRIISTGEVLFTTEVPECVKELSDEALCTYLDCQVAQIERVSCVTMPVEVL
jgi:hypothetical protein